MDKPKPQMLYRFFNAEGELLYVGLTRDIGTRWKHHAADKEWFTEIASSTLEHFPTRDELVAAEKRAIRTEKPKYNIAGTPPRPRLSRLEVRGLDGTFCPTRNEVLWYAENLAALDFDDEWPCPECLSYQVVRGLDDIGAVLADLVLCIGCHAAWTTEAWDLESRSAA